MHEVLETEAAEAASINNQNITMPSFWPSGSRVSTKIFRLTSERFPIFAVLIGAKTVAKLDAIASNKHINDMRNSVVIE